MLRDLDTMRFIQRSVGAKSLFTCSVPERDLRGTGALRYIRGMSGQPAAMKKQTGRTLTIKEALEAQGGGRWYAPKALPTKAHIWLRKAVEGTFAPFLFGKSVVMDQRCNRIVPKRGIAWRELAAVLSSSLFALALESDGTASMGAGALEWPTKKLKLARIVDVRRMTKAQRTQLTKLAEAVWAKGKPHNFADEDQPDEWTQKLDAYLLHFMGGQVELKALYADIHETCSRRIAKARARRTKAKAQEKVDVRDVAESIAATVRARLEGKQFPEAFFSGTTPTYDFDLESRRELQLEGSPFLGEATITVSDDGGHTLLDVQYPQPVGEVIVRALLLGRRRFKVPQEPEEAETVLKSFDGWYAEIQAKIDEGREASALGTRFESELLQAILGVLGIEPNAGAHDPWGLHVLRAANGG